MNNVEMLLLEKGMRANPCVIEGDGLTEQERKGVVVLQANGYVDAFPDGSYRITAAGITALSVEKQRLQDKEDEHSYQAAARAAEHSYIDENRKKQFSHDWRIAIFNLVGGFILGTIADHFFDIVGYALRLWAFLCE